MNIPLSLADVGLPCGRAVIPAECVHTSSFIESLISSLLIRLFAKNIIPQEIQVPLVVFFVLFLVLLVFCEVERVPFDAVPPVCEEERTVPCLESRLMNES